MKHKEKQRIARRLLNTDPSAWIVKKDGTRVKRKGIGIFQTDAWDKRKKAIEEKVKVRELNSKNHDKKQK